MPLSVSPSPSPHPHHPPNPPAPSIPSIMAAGVIAAAWGWQRQPPSISLTTNSHEDGWCCTPQLISIYEGGERVREGRGGKEGGIVEKKIILKKVKGEAEGVENWSHVSLQQVKTSKDE